MEELSFDELKSFLDEKVDQYNCLGFIESDPISIPHRFDLKEDIEIAGFLAATIAWGNRTMIIRNANRLMAMFDEQPFEFITQASETELERVTRFVHRTMNGIDTLFFIHALRNIYLNRGGLESVFTEGFQKDFTVFSALDHFRTVFFEIDHLHRSEKHVSSVVKGASAKRLNMYLRWMVRSDRRGVDFGLWKAISSSALMLPLDVHTGNISRKLGLLERKQNDWRAVEEVTQRLRQIDAADPVKYDFALFGLGVNDHF